MSNNYEIQRIRLNRNAWKTSLTKEILHLEDNLDQIYIMAGLKPHRIVQEVDEEQESIEGKLESLNQTDVRDYDSVIDDHVDEIRQAVKNICSLISVVTEFELPIPVLVLLKLANRISLIRCQDFKKKVPGTLSKKYILNKRSLDLISIGLSLHEWISLILSTNIIPFQTNTNQHLINLLNWTRTSNLCAHDEDRYHAIRLQAIATITKMVEMFSMNLNLDPNQLNALIDEELLASLNEFIDSQSTSNIAQKYAHLATDSKAQNGHINQTQSNIATNQAKGMLKNKYTCASLLCLDRLFVAYADVLGAKLESKVKTFVIQTLVKVYRDFDRNTIQLPCRIQLMRLLENVANRPFATSTTELAWHLFELCDNMETDQEIRYIARRSIGAGLAHRPIIVSHFDVHSCYAKACETIENSADDDQPKIVVDDDDDESEMVEKGTGGGLESANCMREADDEEDKDEIEGDEHIEVDDKAECNTSASGDRMEVGGDKAEVEDVERVEQKDKADESEHWRGGECNGQGGGAEAEDVNDDDDDDDDDSEDDEGGQVKPYLDLFVDSPVTNVTRQDSKE